MTGRRLVLLLALAVVAVLALGAVFGNAREADPQPGPPTYPPSVPTTAPSTEPAQPATRPVPTSRPPVELPEVDAPAADLPDGQDGHRCRPGERDGDGDGRCGEGR